ncbi:hypothetical protein P9112_003783 [Eukaryota sp. TZLM1-RC]
MRMRCYLWPCYLPNDLFCKCGASLTLSHLFNCNRFISYRSTLHGAVRDQIHAMCNSYHIESFVEPLLRSLDINESVRDSEYGKRRADVVVPSFDDVLNVVGVVTVENNFIFNLDFKNAFNSVKREAIFEVIKSDFPELSSFFYHFYGKESDLIFNSFGLKSSSGVKQGDPLGPLLFCLAIHKTLNIIKQKYPSIKIVAYMDDISLIGSFDLLELVAQEIADSYENIGLHLNASKCLLIGSSAQDLVINDSIVPFTNYSSDAFKFLGCWLGNVPQIQNELQVILEKMKIELDSISSLSNLMEYAQLLLVNLFLVCWHQLSSIVSKIFSICFQKYFQYVFNMAQTARISCIKEPLLKETLSLNNFGSDDRGDVYCDWIDNSEAIVDFVSCNVANDTLVHRRKLNPVAALDFKAKEKHRKYDKEIEDANIDRNTQLVFIAFPFSINGRLSVEAETFLDDFQKMVKEKTMKRFDIFLWRSRIQFAIINRLPRFFNRIREALARQQANQDFVEEILV